VLNQTKIVSIELSFITKQSCTVAKVSLRSRS